jgi:hypothetical protein
MGRLLIRLGARADVAILVITQPGLAGVQRIDLRDARSVIRRAITSSPSVLSPAVSDAIRSAMVPELGDLGRSEICFGDKPF